MEASIYNLHALGVCQQALEKHAEQFKDSETPLKGPIGIRADAFGEFAEATKFASEISSFTHNVLNELSSASNLLTEIANALKDSSTAITKNEQANKVKFNG